MKEAVGLAVKVRGIVQGVGFRPFVYGLAARLGLAGSVRNTSSGVEIELFGPADQVDQFMRELEHNPPPLALIDRIESRPIEPNGATGFVIEASQPQPGEFIPVSPDAAICADCRRELLDPADRRYRYPFINCTNCGPRFTIIQDIPYDRPKTTMAGFSLCEACASEYHNPLDRRFHAQPVACPNCGPQVWLEAAGTRLGAGEDAISAARALLAKGGILAVKGLGGYHLACDATNASAVETLRSRKQRSDKPFALMAYDMQTVEKYCEVSEVERAMLLSPASPIVLLRRREGAAVAPGVAPNQATLGVMLPYTPLHLLLLEKAPGFPDLLVMTSGNLSDEPIAYQDGEAHERLAPLADAFLLHNREIHMRVDDSVVREVDGEPYFVRRSRGYAPTPIRMMASLPPQLAAGAELKNAFCLTRGPYAFLSHFIGDMENYETLRSFEEGVRHYEKLFRVSPEAIACDLHPDYLASRYAAHRAEAEGLPLIKVQHHHAHLAACLADNGWDSDEPVIGLSFDGTGLGEDGAIWGGEVLLGGYAGYRRLYHLAYTPLPGGDAAVHKPARMALAHLRQAGIAWDPDLEPAGYLCSDERTMLDSQLRLKINTPLTSSMGRLFDAAAALLGVRESVTYEGQAAIELEALADPQESGWYNFDIQAPTAEGQPGIFDPKPLWSALTHDWQDGTPVPALAARFHNSVARIAAELCGQARRDTGAQVVALSGGVWQNAFLLRRTLPLLRERGFTVLLHRQTPPNDGCIALGQALIAAHTIRR